jgi:hypothetical protein
MGIILKINKKYYRKILKHSLEVGCEDVGCA